MPTICSVNKRLDKWVTEDLIDVDRAKFPPMESIAGAVTQQAEGMQVGRKR